MNTNRFLLIFSLGLLILLALIWDLSAATGPVRAFMDTAVTPTPGTDDSGIPSSRELDPISQFFTGGRTQPQVVATPDSPDSEAIANGDFEHGQDGSWQEYSNYGWDLIRHKDYLPVSPRSGSWAAWLGGDFDHISSISQKVTIPGEVSALTYWNWIASEDSCGFDFGGVLIDNNIVQEIELCEENNTGRWVKRKVDLRAYAGQTVTIIIRAETDDMLNSNYFIDDVTLDTIPISDSSAYLPVILKNFGAVECRYDDGTLHEYFPFESPYISHAVQIDGKISSNSEWSQAVCMDLRLHEGVDPDSPNVHRARWWVQNDGQFAYYLARVPKNLPIAGVAVDYFWPEYTGTWAHSDGVFVNIQGEYQDMANWDENRFYQDIELTPPGTIDAEAAASQDTDFYWLEIKKDLNSGDQYDWAVAPGQTVGHNPEDSFLFALIFQEGYFTRSLQMHIGAP